MSVQGDAVALSLNSVRGKMEVMRSTGDEHVARDACASTFELAERLGLPVASKTTVAQFEMIMAGQPVDES